MKKINLRPFVLPFLLILSMLCFYLFLKHSSLPNYIVYYLFSGASSEYKIMSEQSGTDENNLNIHYVYVNFSINEKHIDEIVRDIQKMNHYKEYDVVEVNLKRPKDKKTSIENDDYNKFYLQAKGIILFNQKAKARYHMNCKDYPCYTTIKEPKYNYIEFSPY